MWQDIRVAWRFLLKARTSTTLAVLTLGVAVAVCSVIVGTLDETVWRPLAFDGGARLVTVYNSRPSAPQFQALSYPDYVEVRDATRDGLELAAFVRIFHTLTAGDWPARVQGELVSGNYFAVLGAKPFLGRLISREDDRIPAGHPVVVLGHDFWRRTFQADPGVVGKSIRLNRRDYTVIGVASPGFRGPAYQSQFWIPLMMAQQVFGGVDILPNPAIPFLQTIGSLQRETMARQLQGRVQALETAATADGWRLTVLPGGYLRFWPAYRNTVTQYLGIFAALAGCVLVIASANLAGLLLSRTAERRRDLSIRQALGASRWQLLRRLLAESMVLTALGGALGGALVYVSAQLAEQIVLPVPVQVSLTPDARLAGISVVVSLTASLLFTVVFAARGATRDVRGVLASTAVSVAPRAGAQSALVVAQIAISCVCLIGAGLLVRSALAVGRIDIGFEATDMVSGMVGLAQEGYTPATSATFYERLLDDLQSQPQVDAVAIEWHPALGAMRAVGRFVAGDRDGVDARYNVVGPGYFEALRIPMLAGREFQRTDRASGEPVAIVNETMAARIGADPLGRTLRFGQERTPRRIVGVVRDLKYNALTEPPQPFVYLPLAQAIRQEVWIHLRTRAPGAESLLRTRLRLLDPEVALSSVHTFAEQLDQARATPRISARISAGIGSLALFLAGVGVYGLLAASVAERRRELSIRAALGATPQDIFAEIAAVGLRLTTLGVTAGMAAGLIASGMLAALLYGVPAHDPVVFSLVPAVIFAISIPAWLAPARRAARANPIEALKAVD